MLLLMLLVLSETKVDTTRPLIAVPNGGEGTGFILWGDADPAQLLISPFPSPTEDMKKDTLHTFIARAAFEIDSSGAIIKEPQLLKQSAVPLWDTIVLQTLRGWVFEPSPGSVRRDTIELRYVVRIATPAKDSVTKTPDRKPFNPYAFTSTQEILGDRVTLNPPRDSVVPMGINFTFSGELGLNDLQAHTLPNLEESMKEKGVTSATARFSMSVDGDGWVKDVIVIQSSGRTAWDSELEKAIKQWRFRASYKNERKVEVIFVISLE